MVPCIFSLLKMTDPIPTNGDSSNNDFKMKHVIPANVSESLSENGKKMLPGVNKIIEAAMETIAETYFGGDKKKLMETMAIGMIVKDEEREESPEISRQVMGGAIIGTSSTLLTLIANLSSELAHRIAEESGVSFERAMMKVNADATSRAAMIMSADEAERKPITRNDAERLKKEMENLSMEDIKNLLG